MKYILIQLLFLAPAISSASTDKACILEGKFELMRQKFDIKDCAQNEGIETKTFKEMCKSFSEAAAALGAPPAKITYAAKCPEKPQASCAGYTGQKMTFFYYKRDAGSIKDAETSCKAMGGKWKKL
jgi:hypothetical protein